MNTPEPCDKCKWCDWDCMVEDDPDESAWCNKRRPMGNLNCVEFKLEEAVKGENDG